MKATAMGRLHLFAAAILLASGCGESSEQSNEPSLANQAAGAPYNVSLSLTRLDCGSATIKEFDSFFSDRPGLYSKGPREITDSCYLIRHGDQEMLWDTGLSADLKGRSQDMADIVFRLDRTLVEQLAELDLTPGDIDIVGISHMHIDHTGQAALFSNARLIVGKRDFEMVEGKDDPFRPWRVTQANLDEQPRLTLATGDFDIFGDGSVVVLHLPGHTPDHLALLVRLASGPVLLSGDLYHSTEAREKRGVPPFNTSREQTLQSMDRFEKFARELKARVIIQHEPADIAKLPAFPQAAE